MKIIDGKGTGKLAEVGEDHRLKVDAIASDRAVEANAEGNAFTATTPILSIAAATETKIAFFRNADTQNSVTIDLEKIYTDLGSTSNNKPIIFRCYVGGSAPSANAIEKDARSTNTEASGRPSIDFFYWDGVGSGITQVVAGDLLGESIHLMAPSENKLPSKLILGPSKTLTYSLECAEAFTGSVHVFAHTD